MMKMAIVMALIATAALGAGTEYRPAEPAAPAKKQSKAADLFAKGKTALEAKNYVEAETLFADASKMEPKNAETLNELAFSQRKQGKLDEAFANYAKALKLKPNFPEAREYLGEAHIQAALHEIETLKSYGADGKEELEDLAKALKDAAASVNP